MRTSAFIILYRQLKYALLSLLIKGKVFALPVADAEDEKQ